MKKLIIVLGTLLSTAALAQNMPRPIMPPAGFQDFPYDIKKSVVNKSEKYTMDVEYAVRQEDRKTEIKVVTIPSKSSAYLDNGSFAITKVTEKDNNQIIHTAEYNKIYGCQAAAVNNQFLLDDELTCTSVSIGE
jgi:hypothetical protein